MNHKNNTVLKENGEAMSANDEAFRDNRADIIRQIFPNLTSLERYALATALAPEQVEKLGQKDYAEEFKLAQVPKAVVQYLDYLSGKENWEKRKNVESRPILHESRQPK